MISRRAFLTHAAGLAAAATGARSAWAAVRAPAPTSITVYKSKSCLCCNKWVDHVRENGFAPTVHDDEDMDRIKDEMGVPKGVRSCHTAMVDKYLIEGHVPAADIRRLLAERPKAAGLAAPGMPSSAPGMLEPGASVKPYDVVAFTSAGTTTVYSRH